MTDQNKDFQGNCAWKANFVGAVQCPWTSNAPISASTNCKVGGKCSDTCHAPPKSQQQHYGINPNSGRITPWTTRNKPTITYFNNFVRLMQLFPEMHPASLHTAMALCKNDFISTVDRLLYVRRYKNGTFFRKETPVATITRRVQRKVPLASSIHRSPVPAGHEEGKSVASTGAVPQPMETVSSQSNGDFDAALPTRSFDAKRLVYNNKAKLKNTKAETSEIPAPVTPNAEPPHRNVEAPQEINNPLIPEDLSRNKNHH